MLRGTTAAAASEMHVTQPAVSRLIRDLEDSLGFNLFKRKGGRLFPTYEGSEFFRTVEESFLGLEKLESVAANIRTRESSELKITSAPAIASLLIPLALQEHERYYPNERFAIHTNGMSEIIVKLQTNAVDLAIGRVLPQLAGIDQEFIGNARFVFAARADHPLASKQTIHIDDLRGESVLCILDTHPTSWSELRDVLDPIKPLITQRFSVDTSHTAYALIAAGLAVGVLEPFAARVWQGNGVITRAFEPQINYPYCIAYPTNTKHHKSLHNIVQSIKTVTRTMKEFNH
jgi:DNA-binding transcriptional LysR family regulator